jgi:hypothetical protein
MHRRKDSRFIWTQYEALQKLGVGLKDLEICSVDPKAALMRSEIRVHLREARRKLKILNDYILKGGNKK